MAEKPSSGDRGSMHERRMAGKHPKYLAAVKRHNEAAPHEKEAAKQEMHAAMNLALDEARGKIAASQAVLGAGVAGGPKSIQTSPPAKVYPGYTPTPAIPVRVPNRADAFGASFVSGLGLKVSASGDESKPPPVPEPTVPPTATVAPPPPPPVPEAKKLPETLAQVRDPNAPPNRRLSAEQWATIPEKDRADFIKQMGMGPPEGVVWPPPATTTDTTPSQNGDPSRIPSRPPRPSRRQATKPPQMPVTAPATPPASAPPPAPVPEFVGPMLTPDDILYRAQQQETDDEADRARDFTRGAPDRSMQERRNQAAEAERIQKMREGPVLGPGRGDVVKQPKQMPVMGPSYLQKLYGQRQELPSLGHAVLGELSGRQTWAERREQEKKGGTFEKSFGKDLTRVLMPEWAETLGFNNKYAPAEHADASSKTNPNAGRRRGGLGGVFPGGSGTAFTGGSGTSGGGGEAGDKANADLIVTIKELTAAVKELTVAVKEKSRQSGGSRSGGSQTQATPAGAKGVFDQLKRAVANSGNEMIGRMSNSVLSRSGPAMEGGVAEGAGAVAAEAAPAAAGGAMEAAAGIAAAAS